ncbi:MAG: PorV/PorQ family protein, partial [Ignavibacteriaceae bacterium]
MKLKKIYKLLIILICLIVLSNTGFAQIGGELNKTGTTAAQILKIGVGPRPIGMGGAYTALADDINSIYWNPAGLARMNSREAYFNHVDWIADVNLDYAGFAMDISGLGTLGTFVSVLSMGDMAVRTLENPEGTGERFSAGALILGLSFARNLTDEFSIGFNTKYINEYIWNENAVGFAFDIGTQYIIPFLNQFRLAASISNFGPKMKLSGRDALQITNVGSGNSNIINTDLQLDEFELPLIFRFGVSIDAVKFSENRLTLAVDDVHPNDNTEHVNTGLEYSWNEILFIRGGYKSLFENEGEQGFTLGIGLNYRLIESVKLKLDYAYQ